MELEVILGYEVKPCLKNTTTTKSQGNKQKFQIKQNTVNSNLNYKPLLQGVVEIRYFEIPETLLDSESIAGNSEK